MKTADEIYSEYSNTNVVSGIFTKNDIKGIMIQFAKLHVDAALNLAYEKAALKEEEEGDEQICYMSNDMGDSYVLDKNSILNAYQNIIK